MGRTLSTFCKRSSANTINSGRQARALPAFRVYRCLALGLFLLSCSYTPTFIPLEQVSGPLPNYTIISIIHGDGDYLFHDIDGRKLRADEEALAGMKKVAERNSQAEVFIFHEKRRKKFLFFFPRQDGEFYYYRNGQMLARELYRRNQGQSRFDPEKELYLRLCGKKQPRLGRLFLYFGHEIPEFGGEGYDASYRRRTFTIEDLADGLKDMTRESGRFDLIVLSTCFNGTPYTVSALYPFTRFLIASPGNLHLSYLDSQPLEKLELGLGNGDISAFAREYARQAFERLTKDIQTEITIAVYDLERVQGYLNSVDSIYVNAMDQIKEKAQAFVEHCDCAENSAYVRPDMSEGIEVFYRAARFGRFKHKKAHSGWECLKLPK